MEGVEWVWDNGLLKAQDVERAKTNIQTPKQLEEVKLKEFKIYCLILSFININRHELLINFRSFND